MNKWYSFTLLSMEFHELKIAMGVRKVVNKTRKRLIPSIPTWYCIPMLEIQRKLSWNCIPRDDALKERKRGIEKMNVMVENESAKLRINLCLFFLTASNKNPPIRGRNVMTLSMKCCTIYDP